MDINVLLFNDFEVLDVFGPTEMFWYAEGFNVEYFSLSGGLIPSKQGAVVLSHPIANADPTQVLFIPGGLGTREAILDHNMISTIRDLGEKSNYTLTVCTGSSLLAESGLLDGKKATTNKMAFDWVTGRNPQVNWQKNARWVVDDKFYTSSGVTAGMDMTLGFIRDRGSLAAAEEAARKTEYIWNQDSENDPFSLA